MAPVKILAISFFFKNIFLLSPAAILYAHLSFLVLVKLSLRIAYPSTAELLKGGRFNLLLIFEDRILSFEKVKLIFSDF